MENLEKIFDFLHKIENLKSTLRYSSTTSGRKESTAEHSWRLALITFMISDELKLNVDTFRSVKIALVHDLAESLTGDIDAILIAEGKVSAEDKENAEKKAILELKTLLPENIGEEILTLWHEYHACETQESKFVKALDKIETLTQFIETGYRIYDKPEFIPNYANKCVKNFPELTEMLKIVKLKLKQEFNKGNIGWRPEYDSLD